MPNAIVFLKQIVCGFVGGWIGFHIGPFIAVLITIGFANIPGNRTFVSDESSVLFLLGVTIAFYLLGMATSIWLASPKENASFSRMTGAVVASSILAFYIASGVNPPSEIVAQIIYAGMTVAFYNVGLIWEESPLRSVRQDS